MTDNDLKYLIQGCKSKKKESQRKLFSHMFNYGMSIAVRYTNSLEDAEEVANDSFYKMFKKIDLYKDHIPFKAWLRRIIINTGIDHYRKNKKDLPVSHMTVVSSNLSLVEEKFEDEFLVSLLRKLSPQYRMVFVLHAIEGFSHEEIAKKLKITKGTSKSNLSKARAKLKVLLATQQSRVKNYG